MEMNKVFKDGLWSKEINVSDFVYTNITPYEGDASFLAGPTERTKKVWNECLKALEEERANNGVRSLDNVTVSTITSHKAGYIDRENELIVGLQTDELLRRARGINARAASAGGAQRTAGPFAAAHSQHDRTRLKDLQAVLGADAGHAVIVLHG